MSDAALTCPECGAANAVGPGLRVATCPGCNVSSWVVGFDAAPRVMVAPSIDSAAATRAARSFLGGMRVRERMASRAQLEAPRLQLLPFVRVEADVLGWLFGISKTTDSKGHATYHDEEIEIAEPHDDALPLCDAGESGVWRLPPLAAVATEPLDELKAGRWGELVPALEADQSVEERTHDAWLAAARKKHQLHQVTGEEIALVGTRQTIVHYPFWRVAYRFLGADYAVMIDARSGAIAAGKAPGSRLFGTLTFAVMQPVAAVVMTLAVLAAGALIYAGVSVGDTSDTVAGGLIVAGLAVGAAGIAGGMAVANAGHRGLRLGAEVEGGYGVRPDAGLFESESDSDFRKRRAAERDEIERDTRLKL
jgi:hypothetical protein